MKEINFRERNNCFDEKIKFINFLNVRRGMGAGAQVVAGEAVESRGVGRARLEKASKGTSRLAGRDSTGASAET